MSDTIVEDRRATRAEIEAHRSELRSLADRNGLRGVRVLPDGALVIPTQGHGYLRIAGFVDVATEIVGAYVYLSPEQADGAAVAEPL